MIQSRHLVVDSGTRQVLPGFVVVCCVLPARCFARHVIRSPYVWSLPSHCTHRHRHLPLSATSDAGFITLVLSQRNLCRLVSTQTHLELRGFLSSCVIDYVQTKTHLELRGPNKRSNFEHWADSCVILSLANIEIIPGYRISL